MPPWWKKENFQQLGEFECERLISLREGEFCFRAIATRMHRNSTTVMRVGKQCSPLQLGKIGEKIYEGFIFWLKTPSASSKRKPKSSPCNKKIIIPKMAEENYIYF